MKKKARILALMMALVMTFAMGLSACGKEASQTDAATEQEDAATADAGSAQGVGATSATISSAASGMYVIEEIDKEEKTIRFYNVETDRMQTYWYDDKTAYYDRAGSLRTLDAFTPGCMVALSVASGTYTLEVLQISSDVFTYTDLTGSTIGQLGDNAWYITINGDKYHMTSGLRVFEDGALTGLSRISDNDILTVYGHDRTVDSIVVTTGHGTILLKNTENYVGGYYTIGNFATGSIEEETTIMVTAGTYLFSAAGSGYGGSAEVTVTANEVTVVDLSQIDNVGSRTCDIQFNIYPETATLYIDGVEYDYIGAITLPYGAHSMKIMATGYDVYSRTLVVNSPYAELTFDLAYDAAVASADAAASSSSGSSSSSSSSSSSNSGSSSSSGTSSQTGHSSYLNDSSSSSGTSSSSTGSSGTTNLDTDAIISTLTTLLSQNSSSDTSGSSSYSILNGLF